MKHPQLIFLPIVSSTNQYLINNIKKLKTGDVCITEYQYLGRGTYGKKWFSSFGCNICFSIYWKLKKKNINGLSLVIGIAIAEILKKIGVKNIKIKWPNDLYFNKYKLGGILVEVINVKEIILGFGINLKRQNFLYKSVSNNAISLEEIIKNFDRNTITTKLINKIRTTLIKFEKYGFNFFFDKWQKFDYFINKSVQCMIENKKIFGIARGVDLEGKFILEEKNKKTKSWIIKNICLI